ncbi:MAG: hypothetical protein QNJ57_00200 [Flavobacteriaceae bacterium]|nr:hypothetical protein [Flavobacteriaceae bacterium]
MKKILKKSASIVINGTTMIPLMVFLLFTNQNKELDRLISILKASVEVH